MTFERDYSKYFVLKTDDIRKYSTEEDHRQLDFLAKTVAIGREKEGKKENTYVVVNEDEPYTETVWKLIEIGETRPDLLELILADVGDVLKNWEKEKE